MLFHRHLSRPCAGAAALASTALALTAAASPAHAACGDANVQNAKRTHAAHGAAPLVVGDSTSLLAAPKLAGHGISTDAMGCRQWSAGLAILSAHRHDHTLPRLAIMALGANGDVTAGQVGQALRITGPDRVLGLVTPMNSASTQAVMRRAARRHPQRVLLIDWARHAAGHGGWFIDGLHPSYPGATAFTRYIAQRVQPTTAKLQIRR
jgi:hypothetical protein